MYSFLVITATLAALQSVNFVTGAGLVGDPCTLDGTVPCTASNSYCLKNTVCQQGVCKCLAGYVQLDAAATACVIAPLSLGAGCQGNVQCGVGATCSAGICSCMTGYRRASDGINCLQGIQVLGGNCTFNSDCGRLAICGLGQTCQCAGILLAAGDGYSCRYLTNGESCTASNYCDMETGIQCLGGQCQCPAGQVWMNTTIGNSPSLYNCVSQQAIFTRTYGQDCHDLTSSCGTSNHLRACIPGLVCVECPEDAGTCIRQCLFDTALALNQTTTQLPTTITTTRKPTVSGCEHLMYSSSCLLHLTFLLAVVRHLLAA